MPSTVNRLPARRLFANVEWQHQLGDVYAASPDTRPNRQHGDPVTRGMALPHGQGRVVADFQGDDGAVCLVVYPDESWGIEQDGEPLFTWGPGETAACMTTFVQMGGFDASVVGMGVTEGRPGTSSFHDRPAVITLGRPITGFWGRDGYRYN